MDDLAIGRMPVKRVQLAVTQDTVCPWCFIGWRELEKAMIQAQDNGLAIKFDVEFKPFRLNKALTGSDRVDKNDYYNSKFGPERYDQIKGVITERGKQVGINFEFSGPIRGTDACHRLLRHAYYKQRELTVCNCPSKSQTRVGGELDLQGKLANELYAAFFERAEDIGDYQVLAKYAERVGLMSRDETLTFLNSDAHDEEVEELVNIAQEQGVTGVPHTVINSRWAIVGGQTSDVYYQIFERLAVS